MSKKDFSLSKIKTGIFTCALCKSVVDYFASRDSFPKMNRQSICSKSKIVISSRITVILDHKY